MNKKPYLFLSAAAVFLLTVLILAFPSRSLFYACNGLDLWFKKMIPTLFPFMVLSGIMIRMNLTDSFVKIVKPVLTPLFRVNGNCLYVLITGFLCGFPMGAVVISQLYERKKLTKPEAEFLLAFCNNIGPVYFLSFAMPVIGITKPAAFLFGMYGIPLLYGLFLRYTVYRDKIILAPPPDGTVKAVNSFMQALDESVMASLTSITKLGGYMIFFNLLNIVPDLFLKENSFFRAVVSAFFEITGGLLNLKNKAPIISLCMMTFGGLSCIAQTNSSLQTTDLSLKKYTFHKLILTALCAAYYLFLI